MHGYTMRGYALYCYVLYCVMCYTSQIFAILNALSIVCYRYCLNRIFKNHPMLSEGGPWNTDKLKFQTQALTYIDAVMSSSMIYVTWFGVNNERNCVYRRRQNFN